MIQSKLGLQRTINKKTASEVHYDAVIVGAGIAGAILAKELSKKGKRVLIVEAGPGKDLSMEGYQKYICLLYTSPSPRDATLSRMPSSA